MNDILLNLGGIDVSDRVLAGYKVDIEPVYDSKSFVNMYGEEIAPLIGRIVSISVTLGECSGELAARVLTACDTDELSVTYAYPVEYTATFKRPKISSVLLTEIPATWDIQISMTTGVIPLDGL